MFNFFKKEKKPENIKEVLDYLKNLEKKIENTSEGLKNQAEKQTKLGGK